MTWEKYTEALKGQPPDAPCWEIARAEYEYAFQTDHSQLTFSGRWVEWDLCLFATVLFTLVILAGYL